MCMVTQMALVKLSGLVHKTRQKIMDMRKEPVGKTGVTNMKDKKMWVDESDQIVLYPCVKLSENKFS